MCCSDHRQHLQIDQPHCLHHDHIIKPIYLSSITRTGSFIFYIYRLGHGQHLYGFIIHVYDQNIDDMIFDILYI